LPEHDPSRHTGDEFVRASASADAWADRDLLEGVRRRDADALGRFFDAAFPYVYNLAYRLVGNREAAEDIAQEVFLKVHRAADRIDPARNARPWVTTITYNAVRDAARRTSARPEDATDPATIGERARAQGTPDDELRRKQSGELVERALLALDETQRTIVLLFDFCGVSHAEIAEIVGASHDAVRKRYSRALKQMWEYIGSLER
jgi:RNA polymerase sigma-70 factor (ECF subfamily)